MESGRPFPPWDKRPRLKKHLEWLVRAFMELVRGRDGKGIPWEVKAEYAQEQGVADLGLFVRLIDALEDEVNRYNATREERTVTRKVRNG